MFLILEFGWPLKIEERRIEGDSLIQLPIGVSRRRSGLWRRFACLCSWAPLPEISSWNFFFFYGLWSGPLFWGPLKHEAQGNGLVCLGPGPALDWDPIIYRLHCVFFVPFICVGLEDPKIDLFEDDDEFEICEGSFLGYLCAISVIVPLDYKFEVLCLGLLEWMKFSYLFIPFPDYLSVIVSL